MGKNLNRFDSVRFQIKIKIRKRDEKDNCHNEKKIDSVRCQMKLGRKIFDATK